MVANPANRAPQDVVELITTSSTALHSFKRAAFYFSGRKIIDHERISTGKS
ncbi:MAG: hypothetical protein ACLTG4_09910 [Oscillospiraceae bacterium]